MPFLCSLRWDRSKKGIAFRHNFASWWHDATMSWLESLDACRWSAMYHRDTTSLPEFTKKKKAKNDRGWTTRVRSHRHLILQSPYFLKKCNDLSTFYRNYVFTHNNKIHYKNTKISSAQMHYSNKFFQTRRKISSIGIKFHPFPFNWQ